MAPPADAPAAPTRPAAPAVSQPDQRPAAGCAQRGAWSSVHTPCGERPTVTCRTTWRVSVSMKVSLRAQREVTQQRAAVGQHVDAVRAAGRRVLGDHRQRLEVDLADRVGHPVADIHMALVTGRAEGVRAVAGLDALDQPRRRPGSRRRPRPRDHPSGRPAAAGRPALRKTSAGILPTGIFQRSFCVARSMAISSSLSCIEL